jgi:hypothetical protein
MGSNLDKGIAFTNKRMRYLRLVRAVSVINLSNRIMLAVYPSFKASQLPDRTFC